MVVLLVRGAAARCGVYGHKFDLSQSSCLQARHYLSLFGRKWRFTFRHAQGACKTKVCQLQRFEPHFHVLKKPASPYHHPLHHHREKQ